MAYIDKEAALAILKVAQEGGYLEEFPTESKLIPLAEHYVTEAKREADSDAKMKRDPTIKKILALNDTARSEALERKSEAAFEQFVGGTLELTNENLPIPGDPKDEPTPFPLDFTELTDKEVRRLHGQYNAYLGRARWLLATTSNKLSDATHLRDDAYRKGYRQYEESLNDGERRVTKDLIDSYVKTEYIPYTSLDTDVRNETELATTYKALVEIYSGNVDRLSREWTMRTDEERRY